MPVAHDPDRSHGVPRPVRSRHRHQGCPCPGAFLVEADTAQRPQEPTNWSRPNAVNRVRTPKSKCRIGAKSPPCIQPPRLCILMGSLDRRTAEEFPESRLISRCGGSECNLNTTRGTKPNLDKTGKRTGGRRTTGAEQKIGILDLKRLALTMLGQSTGVYQ